MARPTFQEQIYKVREDAIVAAVNRLLAEKGFELMTVDAVAAEVGIAKASLYKHFRSKEDLAAAAMMAVLDLALAEVRAIEAEPALAPEGRLYRIAEWAIRRLLAGEMPLLPVQNSSLRDSLMSHRGYMDRLMQLSAQLLGWIGAAQQVGAIDDQLPAEVVLYVLFARGCDPVVGVLKASGSASDDQIVHWTLRACFGGLASRAPAPAPAPASPRPAAARRTRRAAV